MTEHKSSTKGPKIAVLWRGDAEARRTAAPQNNRFHRVFEEFAAIGVDAEPAVYDEEFADGAGASSISRIRCACPMG